MQLDQLLLSSLRSFGELLKVVNAPRYNYKDEVSAASWIDELGRLRIWAGNVGAHQSGSSSLEFRLRDSSHIRDEVKNLLTDLERLLAEAQKYISTEDHGSETSSTNDSSDEEPTTELQALFGEVVTIIQCLYKLAMIIRNPAQHDFLAESYKADTAAFEPFDEQHVRNKFPQAKEELIHRLAKALTRRRGYLKYRARHSMKLKKGLEDIQIGGAGVAASISETTASVLQAQPVDYHETSSDSGISHTSYASSIVEGGTITVPPPPKGSLAGNPFPCPYCHFVINPATTHAWHRHVFADLRPYTCICQPCRTPDKLFPSRHDWLNHIRDIHGINSLLCPLCKAVMETVKQYERHVARHMEELALFVLPRFDLDDEDEEGDPDDRGICVSGSDETPLCHDADEWLESEIEHFNLSKPHQDGSSLRDFDEHNRSPEHTEWAWQCTECPKRFSTREELERALMSDSHKESPREGLGSSDNKVKKSEDGKHDYIIIERDWGGTDGLSGEVRYRLEFDAGSISYGDLTVGKIKLDAHRQLSKHLITMRSTTPDSLEYYFDRRKLDDDALSCHDAGINSGAVILARIPPNTKRQRMNTLAPKATLHQVEEGQVINLKDCLGRKWQFPFQSCSTWDTMNRAIREIFFDAHDHVRSDIAQGCFDLMGPGGYAIPPQHLEDVIQPGLHITMHLWQPDDSRRQPKEKRLSSSDQPKNMISGGSPNVTRDFGLDDPSESTPPLSLTPDQKDRSQSANLGTHLVTRHVGGVFEFSVEKNEFPGNPISGNIPENRIKLDSS
ncbi:MAG: hypothetical protein Q9204_003563 [Flavoplaca sp. TL-2023a]